MVLENFVGAECKIYKNFLNLLTILFFLYFFFLFGEGGEGVTLYIFERNVSPILWGPLEA